MGGLFMFTTLLAVFVVMGLDADDNKNPEEISHHKFIEMVDKGEVDTVALDATKIYITLTDEARKKELGKDGENGALATNKLVPARWRNSSVSRKTEKKRTSKRCRIILPERVDDETLPQRLL